MTDSLDPSTRGDLLLAVPGTIALLLVIGISAVRAAPAERARTRYGPVVAGVARTGSTGMAETLSAGASIDPDTLELVGVDLQPEDGSRILDWSALKTYEYQQDLEGLPEAIRALEGKRVTMAGFLLPLYEFEDIRDFNLVASHWSCCFGVPPGINGWVHVTLAPGQRGLDNSTEPLKITGTFQVAEQKEAGYVVSIFAIRDATARVLGW